MIFLKKTKIFLVNGIILTITAFLTKSLGMLFHIYISNKIGSEAVGTFSLVMSVYLFFITLSTSGLSLTCTYIVSEQFAKSNFLNGFKAVKSCLLFSLCLGMGSSVLVLLFSKIISQNWLNATVSCIPLYLIAVGLPFISISCVLNGYFSAVRKGFKTAFTQTFELIIKIFVTIFLLNIYPFKTVESICICLILADVISEICSCCLLFIFYKIDKTHYYKRNISNFTFKKRILKITLPVCITSYIRSGLSTLKQFITLKQFVLFGLPYSIALSEYGKINGMTMSILTFPNVFMLSFSNLLIPEFASLLAKQYKKRILQVCQKVFWITSIFSISISSIFFLFANEISLFVFKNLSCSTYIKALSPIILFMYLDFLMDSMLKGLNKQSNVMVCNILDLVLTISTLYFLLPILGLKGYLFAIIISEVFNFCISYFQLYQATHFKMPLFIIGSSFFFLTLGIYEIQVLL